MILSYRRRENDISQMQSTSNFLDSVVGVLGTGVPRLACLRPAAWLKGRPSMAHLRQHELKTLARGQASRGGRRESFLRGSLARLAHEEVERSRQGYLVRCP